jgi:hypothetical protein
MNSAQADEKIHLTELVPTAMNQTMADLILLK